MLLGLILEYLLKQFSKAVLLTVNNAETVVFQSQFVFLCLQLEEGEIDVRFHSFKGCVLEKVQN